MIIEEQIHTPVYTNHLSLIRQRVVFLMCLIILFSGLFCFIPLTTQKKFQTTITVVNNLYYLTIYQVKSAITLKTDNTLFSKPLQSLTPKIVDILAGGNIQ